MVRVCLLDPLFIASCFEPTCRHIRMRTQHSMCKSNQMAIRVLVLLFRFQTFAVVINLSLNCQTLPRTSMHSDATAYSAAKLRHHRQLQPCRKV